MKQKILFFTLLLLIPVSSLSAASFSLVPSSISCLFSSTVTCNLCDLLTVAINASEFMIYALSAVTLLMFILGGVYMIIAAGNEQRVEKGRHILFAAVSGLVIVAFSWITVNTVVRLFTTKSIAGTETATIFGSAWNNVPVCSYTTVSDCEGATLGSLCTNCSSGTGNTGCICKIPGDDGTGYQAELKMGSTCKEGKCECMSFCDVIARDYESYGSYQCMPYVQNKNTAVMDQCLSGDLCPHAAGVDPTHKCCNPDYSPGTSF